MSYGIIRMSGEAELISAASAHHYSSSKKRRYDETALSASSTSTSTKQYPNGVNTVRKSSPSSPLSQGCIHAYNTLSSTSASLQAYHHPRVQLLRLSIIRGNRHDDDSIQTKYSG